MDVTDFFKGKVDQKRNKALYPIRNRISRSRNAYNQKVKNSNKNIFLKNDNLTNLNYTKNKNNERILIYETNCGTSIQCRIVSNFVKASGFPVIFKKTSCCGLDNSKLYDEVDKEINEYVRTKLPALQCGDLMLFDTGAIIRFLDSKFNGSVLIPQKLSEKAIVDQTFEHLTFTIHKSVASYVQAKIFTPFFCKNCEVENEKCFIKAEADNFLHEIKIYLKYIIRYYFRDKNGDHLCKFLIKNSSQKTIKNSQKIQNFPKKSLCFGQNSQNFSKNDQNSQNRQNIFKNDQNFSKIDKNNQNFIQNDQNNAKNGLFSGNFGLNSPQFLVERNPIFFTPISPLNDQKDEAGIFENLCRIIGYSDSLDAVKILVEMQKKQKLQKIDENYQKIDENYQKIDENYQKIDENYQKIDENGENPSNCRLKEIPPLFVVLERFSLADVTLFAIIEQLQFTEEIDLKEEFPLIWYWKKQMLRISSLREGNKKLQGVIELFKKSALEKKMLPCKCLKDNKQLDW